MKKLWYRTPATAFEEALPIGNGSMGGMVYSNPDCDRISLNEDTLWTGYPKDKAPVDPFSGITQAKALIAVGKRTEAERILWEKSLGDLVEWYQPAGNLWIAPADSGECADYLRELDLETAMVTTRYVRGGKRHKVRVFCSHADQVLVYHIETEELAKFHVWLENPHRHTATCKDDVLTIRAMLPSAILRPQTPDGDHTIIYDAPEQNRALTYGVAVKVVPVQGNVAIRRQKAELEGTEFVLLVHVASNYEGFDKFPQEGSIDPLESCVRIVESAAKQDVHTLLVRHLADYQELFNRVDFSLEGNNRDDLPTDQRIVQYGEDPSDVGLPVLLFHYARYLTIAASRAGTQPTNLQGIWNESVTPPWHCNYTININTEMNYWPTEQLNLSECHEPLLRMLAEMACNGAVTARRNYHCAGWCSHHNTDLWRMTEPVKSKTNPYSVQFGFWAMSGAWLSCHIWQHYRYTKDMDFLKEYWPVLKGAGEFLLDWLEEEPDGHLTTPLSTSPENSYLIDGVRHFVSESCAMDLGIVRDLLQCCIAASQELNRDSAFCETAENALARLRPYGINANGTVMEWGADFEENEPEHRHISHLYGLYPGDSINETTPKLLEAAEKTLHRRGYDTTGWAMSWRICAWARLGKGEKTKQLIDQILRLAKVRNRMAATGGGIYENLLVAHPPFQIDGNFGFAAAVVEMLVQQDGQKLLPALPKAWETGGSLKGICLTGKRTLDLRWENGLLVEKTIR